MKILNLLALVSLFVAAAAECPFSDGGGNAPPTDNGAPPPPYSVNPAAPPTNTESPAPPPAYGPALPPTYGPALPPASELTPGPAPSQKNKTGKLSTDYYANICPNLESLVQSAVSGMMATSPISAAATLRLFFHDCFVTVCTFYCFIYVHKENDPIFSISIQMMIVLFFSHHKFCINFAYHLHFLKNMK
jgi:hypothetical protein